MNQEPITVEAEVNADIAKVWEYWNQPEHIMNWAFASDDWKCPAAQNDLKVGGKMVITMAAKDGSAQFDLAATYQQVEEGELIEYVMEDPLTQNASEGQGRRHVKVEFLEVPEGVKIIESFDPENENPREMQQEGWQAILNNFKKYIESN